MAAVYPVPDPTTGDMVMVALEMNETTKFSPHEFDEFLSQQRDLDTKWSPQIIRVITAMPLTANNKVHKPPLRASKWFAADPHYWRPERNQPLQLMNESDKQELEARFAANGRTQILTAL